MTVLPNGFYTALGIPLDQEGNIVPDSLANQIQMQIAAGAAGFLVLGSMGRQAAVRQDQCPVAVSVAADALNRYADLEQKRRPILLAGVMDNSIDRVLDRIRQLADFDLDGVVATTPFYGICKEDALEKFFTQIADQGPFPIYLYDLPGVTKMKITFSLACRLARHPNIRGIKTGDMVLARLLCREESLREKFSVVFSGLDIFDVAASYGVSRFLDGMFACTPKNSKRMFDLFSQRRFDEGGKCLDRILDLRDTMILHNIYPAFTIAMNLLGCSGDFSPDYEPEPVPETWDVIRQKMIDIEELEA